MGKRPYRPSNGSEGDSFMSEFCYQCQRDSEDNPCPILMATMVHDVDEPDYPKEWVRDETGPKCTAFAHKDDEPLTPCFKPIPGQLSLFGDNACENATS